MSASLPAILPTTDFTRPLPRYHGYISVAPNGRYFQDESGRGLIVIGQNDATPWPGLAELFNHSGAEATEEYIRSLRDHGVTVSRVMLEYAQDPATYLEDPIGSFVPAAVRFWDEFIPLAEKHGLYLLLTPYDTFWQAHHWEHYPYHAACGGPCHTLRDWLTLPAAIHAQKARWDFVIRRWGGSPAIFGWDLMNEIDLWWGCTPDEITAYITDLAAYVRELERSTWGRTHLLTCSTSAAVPGQPLQETIYNHPALDFATTHLYAGPGVRNPTDCVEAAPEIIGAVEQSRRAIRRPRPYFDSETGPVYGWIEDRAMDKRYHHNISWAHLASGAAGSGMRWPYTMPHNLLPEFRDNLRGLARVAATIDWQDFCSDPLGDRLQISDDRVIRTGCGDDQRALLWLLRDSRQAGAPALSGLDVTLRGVLADGEVMVEFWETYAGACLLAVPAEVREGTIRFRVPPLDAELDDVAVLIRRAN